MLLAVIGLLSLGGTAQVGINTTDPQRDLDVNGKLMVRDLRRTSSGLTGVKALFTEADGTVVGAELPSEINITDGGGLEINVNSGGAKMYPIGRVTVSTPNAANDTFDDFDLELGSTNEDAVVFILDGATRNFSITGIDGGTDGRHIIIVNTTSHQMNISNQDGDSQAANRIIVLGDDRTTQEGSMEFVYDSLAGRWYLISVEN
ncbi:hypothetical protein [Aureitalea marina]|uniref:Uncharacterized protein n=1 Tax=Aureitalea marina TaxID=930804 RepID=A0A2S7KPM3_9FLAO|nr:hypothetical protein [Aureitalea marina]PQB04584.1 hypothetical protein BST85_06480 [Aureitalea marina]